MIAGTSEIRRSFLHLHAIAFTGTGSNSNPTLGRLQSQKNHYQVTKYERELNVRIMY